ncbi:PREDICTED: uncharacterized protein LOC106741972 [Dinoponera quadriceps]|uniref:non-specific serine/threonine protein kinase n=1 Tax=Dinoponera quadriceps TaxID=609295 RepID=A0A6P3WUY4_DINQU|nr:PREDICTED: uncharacterized protein LOC106741972 [Dinoponera quadriceps]
MMINRKQLIRTYQRKTAKKTFINVSLAPPVISSEKYHIENRDYLTNEACNDSTIHDPFETTFDRLAKGAVIPPLPLDVSQSNSWNSSSDNNITNLAKSPEYVTCNLFTYNDTFGSTHKSVKHICKCKKSQKYKTKVIREQVYKETKVISIKNKIRSKAKIQAQKVQTNNTQRQKIIQYKLKKSSCKFNERTHCSDTTNDLKDADHKDILYNYNNKQLPQSVFKINEDTTITSQTTSSQADDSTAIFKHTLNHKKIKPCCVKLNTHAIQNWHILNQEKTLRNKRNIKHSYKRTSQANKDTFKIHDITLPSISIDHNVSETSKHIRIKSCSIALSDVYKNWKEEDGKNRKDSTDVINETNVSYLVPRQNLSKIVSCSNNDIDSEISSGERNKTYLMKDNFVKVERLKTEELIEKKMKVLNEKEKYMAFSTPIGKRIKQSAYPILSPIKGIRDTLNSRYENLITIEKENVPIEIFPGRKDSTRSFTSECYKIDIRNMQKQQTQVSSSFQKLTELVKAETILSSKDMHSALIQQYNTKNDKITEVPLSLNISSSTDRSRSLFDDTSHNYNRSTQDIIGNDIQKQCAMDAVENMSVVYAVTGDCSNIPSIASNFEHSRNYPKLLDDTTHQRYSNDIDMQVQRSVFLKPGKCWARSLSILNNVNPESNLDKLCTGKGKKWRHSVRDILDMQKQGTFRNCLKKDQDDTKTFCEKLDTSTVLSLGDNRYKTFDSANHKFSKRISIRIVPISDANINGDVQDAPFLEAFGITTENSPLKENTLGGKKSIHNVEYNDKDRTFESHLTTAKDIVLQRCSQKHYLPFSECFPDSYLEHCRKIGEGVYGEVFLYEHAGEKSVIKIIPIEGEELVNGESQKKFNEILSEIVIAEELHNLRLHSTYRTDAFVEVRRIRCIIGRYPEKLVKLWNIYDDDKTSNNDCPSMFGEHQLYIALELGHGGEDLEAFVFQTAQEAYALFLQTALALAVAERAFEFEHRDLHWGNILISRTEESHMYYNLNGREIKIRSNNVKVSVIDYTLSRMLYHGCCIYNDLALDPDLFIAHGEYQFEIYRLMRDKIQNNWQKFEPYTNILWLHYTLDKMITAVRYKKKNLRVHKQAINKLKKLKSTILNYDSAYNFISDSNIDIKIHH